jgi:hypothetical protein
MSNTYTATVELRALRDDEMEMVVGGTLSTAPLGSQPLFWDPVWWQVGQTGHLPTVSVPH